MAVSGFWLSLLSRLGLAHRDGHCYWFFTGIDRRGGGLRQQQQGSTACSSPCRCAGVAGRAAWENRTAPLREVQRPAMTIYDNTLFYLWNYLEREGFSNSRVLQSLFQGVTFAA